MVGLPEGYPVREGLKTGAIAWIGGLGLVFLFLLLAGRGLATLGTAWPIASTTWGWSVLHGWFGVVEGNPAVLIFGLIPASILLGSGYVAAANTSGSRLAPSVRGSAIVVGYGALATLTWGVTLVRLLMLELSFGPVEISLEGLVGFVLVLAVTGVAFPLVFGGIGGALAGLRGH